MNKEEFDILVNDILKIPQPKEELTASSMCSINVEELRQVIEAFNKIPDYNILIKDNLKKDKEIKRLNNIINKFIDDIEDYLDSNPKVFCGDCDIYYSDLERQDKHCEGFNFTIKLQEKINKLKELKESDK